MSIKTKSQILLNSPLFKNTCIYLIFHLSIWPVHVLLISTIAFFHFLLDHGMGVVEDWISYRGWIIIMITKIPLFYVFFRFITINSDSRNTLKSFLLKNFTYPRKEIFAVTILFFIYTLVVGNPEYITLFKVESFKIIISFFSIFIFYITDLLIIKFLNIKYPLNPLEENLQNLLFPLIFFIMGKITFLYAKNMTFLVYFNFLFCLYLQRWKKSNWSSCFLFLIIYVCPAGIIFGLDPIWGSLFSPFKMSNDLKISYFIVLAFMLIGYLICKEKGFYPWQRRVDGGNKS
ncbi:MAG: hypothetical protein OXB84_05090 [Halobacteriovoraceae bacterium]|nr:hypothetical protein [Halobacteriovoraceae bacterium]